MTELSTTSAADGDSLEGRRAALKHQQEAFRRGEIPPPIAPADRSYTQVPRNAGTQRNPEGTHQELRNASGTQERTRGHQRDEAGVAVAAAMPLGDYLLFAAEKNRAALKYAEGWQGVAFTFARHLKVHPGLRERSSQCAGDVVDRQLAKMFPQAEDPWVELLGNTDSAGRYCEPFEHFVEAWDEVLYPIGETPIELAVRLAEEHPVAMPEYPSPRWAPYRHFISICRWLQFAQDGENIYVPVRKFGELIGRPIKTISNYRKRAVRDGYLILVKAHQGRSQATEYRFNLERLAAVEDEVTL